MKTEKEIEQAIKDSEEYLMQHYPGTTYEKGKLTVKGFENFAGALAVASEICTLKWILGKGKLNCYGRHNL